MEAGCAKQKLPERTPGGGGGGMCVGALWLAVSPVRLQRQRSVHWEAGRCRH